MSEQTIFQVDAFASKLFEGNPAAVCPLEAWLPDSLMQQIAAENNLAETAFFVKSDQGYHLRWFTPECEVDLCGHATLASAHVLFEELGVTDETLRFQTRSGELQVSKTEDGLSMSLPVAEQSPITASKELIVALGETPIEVFESDDLLVRFSSQQQVASLNPDFRALGAFPYRGVIATAPGDNHDFVNRFFAPACGIDEDPVTGSSFTKLVPYWAKELNQTEFSARQISERGGEVTALLEENRVVLMGQCKTYLRGSISL